MVIEFSKNIIFDYINGKNIDNIDELENDYKFMMEVISNTKDKNMYNLCSESVKKNYEFIKFIIDTFKSDKDFIHKIAKEYLEKTDENDITYKELIFIMSDIFNKRSDNRAIYYNAKRAVIYTSERVVIDAFLSEEFNESVRGQFGLGFYFVLVSDLNKSTIVTNYFAKKLLEELFYENNNLSIEELIHSKISNLNKLKLIGIKNYIIDYVKNYDVALSDYLFVHIDLINDVEKDINKIIKNWDEFVNKTLDRKMCIFEQEVNNFISDYEANFDYIEICAYIDKTLNLPVKLSFVGNDDTYSINMRKIGLRDYECLKKIIKLAKDLFLSPVIKEDYMFDECDKIKMNNKNKKKLLEFKPKYTN